MPYRHSLANLIESLILIIQLIRCEAVIVYMKINCVDFIQCSSVRLYFTIIICGVNITYSIQTSNRPRGRPKASEHSGSAGHH